MVYKKKTYRKKNYKGKADLALKKVKHLENTLEPEHKQFISSTVGAVGTSGTTWSLMTSIAQGTDVFQRVGNEIRIRRIRFRAFITSNTSGSTTPTVVRIIIVKANQQIQDITPTFGFVVPPVALPFLDYNCNQNTQNSNQFCTVLHDSRHVLDVQGPAGKMLDVDKKVNFKVHFNGVTSSDIQKNGIYVYVASNQSSLQPIVDSISITEFIDA